MITRVHAVSLRLAAWMPVKADAMKLEKIIDAQTKWEATIHAAKSVSFRRVTVWSCCMGYASSQKSLGEIRGLKLNYDSVMSILNL